MEMLKKIDAQTLIGPHLDKIVWAFEDAFQEYYQGKYATLRHNHSPRTEANILRDLVVKNIKNVFDGVVGVQYSEKRSLFLLKIDGVVVLKFKKFNHKLLSSNIPTVQSRLIELQELPGMPPNGLLHVGYLTDRLNTKFNELYITCRHDDNNLWTWNLLEEAVTTASKDDNIAKLPVGDTSTTRRTVTPKREIQKSPSKEDSGI